MSIPAAAFDRRIEIWSKGLLAKNGLGEKLPSPLKLADRWASVGAKAAIERAGVTRTEAVRTEVFTVRYCAVMAAVTPQGHYLVYQGRKYNIRSVTEVGFREAFDFIGDARADNAAG